MEQKQTTRHEQPAAPDRLSDEARDMLRAALPQLQRLVETGLTVELNTDRHGESAAAYNVYATHYATGHIILSVASFSARAHCNCRRSNSTLWMRSASDSTGIADLFAAFAAWIDA